MKISRTPNLILYKCATNNIIFIHYLSLTSPFTRLTPSGPYRNHDLYHIHTFLTTQGHGGSPRMRDQLTSETTRTWKTVYAIHTPIHSNKANMKGWLWRPNDIRGLCGPNVTWHLSYRWGKTPKKPHPGNLYLPGIRTRARCVTDAHDTACSTAVDDLFN